VESIEVPEISGAVESTQKCSEGPEELNDVKEERDAQLPSPVHGEDEERRRPKIVS